MSRSSQARKVSALFAICATFAAAPANAETLTLAQAIEMGLQKAPEVREAKFRTESADYGITAARGRYYPTLSVSGQTGYGNNLSRTPLKGEEFVRNPANPNQPLLDPVTGQPVTRTVQNVSRFSQTGPEISQVTGQVRQVLLDFGKVSSNVGAAEAGYKAASASERETSAQTAGSIATAYLTVFYQEKLFELAKSTLESREKLFQIAKGLVKAGIQPPVEELRSQARLDGARRDHAQAKALYEDARLGLAQILMYDRPSTLRVTTPRLPRISTDQATVMKDAETKRSTVAQAEFNIDRAKEGVDANVAQYWPTFSLLGLAQYTWRFPDDRDNTAVQRLLFAGASMDWNFDFGQFARVDGAEKDVAAAEANYEQAKRDAKTEAARAAIQVRMGKEQLEHAKKAEENTSAVRAVIEARYIRGLSNPLELIDAEDSDLDARTARLQTELAYSNAIVRLAVATGRSLVDEKSTAAVADDRPSDANNGRGND